MLSEYPSLPYLSHSLHIRSRCGLDKITETNLIVAGAAKAVDSEHMLHQFEERSDTREPVSVRMVYQFSAESKYTWGGDKSTSFLLFFLQENGKLFYYYFFVAAQVMISFLTS